MLLTLNSKNIRIQIRASFETITQTHYRFANRIRKIRLQNQKTRY